MTMPNEQDRPPGATAAPTDDGVNGNAAEVAELRASLAAAEARALESRDLYMRALAELDNVRKRASRDVEQAHKYAVDRFANDLVGVKDSLELGLGVQNATLEDLRSGSEATLKLLTKAFEKAGVLEVQAEGQPFNPEFHEAMAMVPAADKTPNTVLNVVQKGYVLNGRLVRPARVIVAKAPE
jgi:molecular chaperone GrpE